MTRRDDQAMSRAVIDVPAGWSVIDPPEGVGLIAVDTESDDAIAPNLVVTMVAAPGPAVSATVDRYLDDLLLSLDSRLDEFDLIDVSVSWSDDHPPSQRVIAHHRCEHGIVEMLQQHTWFEDAIVVSTISVAEGIDHQLADLILDCLDEVALADN